MENRKEPLKNIGALIKMNNIVYGIFSLLMCVASFYFLHEDYKIGKTFETYWCKPTQLIGKSKNELYLFSIYYFLFKNEK